jgi:RND family efflux transporter MFP subunit
MNSKFLLHSTVLALVTTSTLHAAEPTPVRSAHAETAKGTTELTAIGRTAPAQEARLFSRATGLIRECKVDIGDRVKSGDVLAVIEAPEIAHQIAGAKAKVAQMTARAELAAALLKRTESLTANDAVSQQDLDERIATTKTAEADRLAAEAELQGFEEMDRFLTIRAPFDGTITARKIDRGAYVNGDPTNAESWLFSIARLNELRMVLFVPPTTALQIQNDQEAEVLFTDIPGKTFPAKVSRSSSLIEADSGTMRVELLLPNADFSVPAGLSGIAKIKAPSISSTLLVPSNAVAVRNGVSQIALVENEKVKFTPVQVGRTLGPKVEILSGIPENSEVILSPNALLRDGDPVAATPLATAKK